uniref:Ig-like domain-containing protein n=1 Tax=Labrus bergylta TaxID=56723 RepID=A0A3Q3FPX5_9LABR
MVRSSVVSEFEIFDSSWYSCDSFFTGFVKIHCKTQNIGQYEQESRLDCVIHYSKEVEDPEICGKLTSLPGYSFAEPSWNNKNVNVSLLIHKTAVKDEGVYTCYVFTNSGFNINQTRLNVTAKYGVPTIQPQPQDIDLNTDGSLTCKSTGYPKGRLSWFDKDNKPWLEQPEVKVLKTENGLFILSSTLKIQGGSAFSNYTCKVFNARGDEEAEKSFTVQNKPPSARGIRCRAPHMILVSFFTQQPVLFVRFLFATVTCYVMQNIFLKQHPTSMPLRNQEGLEA